MRQDNVDKCLEYENKEKYTDKKLKERLEREYKVEVIKNLRKKKEKW